MAHWTQMEDIYRFAGIYDKEDEESPEEEE